MSWKENKGYISRIISKDLPNRVGISETLYAGKFERRLASRVEYLRSILDSRLSTGINKFLEKDTTDDSVSLFGKYL